MHDLPPAIMQLDHMLSGSPEERAAIDARDMDALRQVNPALVEAMLEARAARRRQRPRCNVCGGSGYRSEYRHVANGECFPCGGSGRQR